MRHVLLGLCVATTLVGLGAAGCGDDTGGGSGGDDAASASTADSTSDATSTGTSGSSGTVSGTGTGGGSSASTGSASTGSGGNAYAYLFDCEETDFEDDFPLGGPGFDPETGIIGEPQETYLVATTQIYRKPEKAGEFMAAAGPVLSTLNESEGMVAFGIGSSAACGCARTLSVWKSEEAMLSFVASDAHAAAMLQVNDLAYTGRTTHWEVTAEELMELDWDVARAKVEDIEGFY